MYNQSEVLHVESLNIHLLTFLFILIEIIGISGNLLVILSVQFDARMRRSLTNQLIVRVGTCDLIILIFNIPDLIQFVSSTNGNWILDQYSCKFIRTVLVLAQYSSVLTMCALTIERFIGIVYPLRAKFLEEKKHVLFITLFVWLFSLICTSPNLIYLQIVEDRLHSRRVCTLIYSKDDYQLNRTRYILHKSIESLIFYFLPLLLQMYSYIRIAQRLFNVDKALQPSFSLMNKNQFSISKQENIDDEENYIDLDESSTTKYTRVDSFSQSSAHRSRQSSCQLNLRHSFHPNLNSRRTTITYNALKSRRNVIKMLFTVVLIYFVSFSPQVLVFLLFETNAIRNLPNFIKTPYFVAFTMLLVTISSASNPIVYAIFCSKFRQSFAKLLRKVFCWCKKNHQSNQRALSLQQIPKGTYRFNERISVNDNKPIQINGGLYSCLS